MFDWFMKANKRVHQRGRCNVWNSKNFKSYKKWITKLRKVKFRVRILLIMKSCIDFSVFSCISTKICSADEGLQHKTLVICSIISSVYRLFYIFPIHVQHCLYAASHHWVMSLLWWRTSAQNVRNLFYHFDSLPSFLYFLFTFNTVYTTSLGNVFTLTKGFSKKRQ